MLNICILLKRGLSLEFSFMNCVCTDLNLRVHFLQILWASIINLA